MNELHIEVVNLTRLAVDEAEMARLVARVLVAEGVPSGELGVRLVGARRMRALNRDHLGHDEVTDVLSFPLEEADELAAGGEPAGDGDPDDRSDAMPRLLGDVVVCPLRAAAQARAAGRPLALELAALLVHGTLHVVGYDHETDTGEMAAREARLLDQSEWEGLLGAA